jgi:hypothetical protein
MKKKILILTFVLLFSFFTISSVNAASSSQKLPNRLTYTWEWVNLHLFTWSTQGKVEKLDQYATKRSQDLATAVELGKTDKIADLSSRYETLSNEVNQIISRKNIKNKTALVEKVQTSAIEQQKTLTEVRQSLNDEGQKKEIASIQEQGVNQLKDNISTVINQDTANTFTNNIVSVWRDPQQNVSNEKATRVYAAGTESSGNTGNSGVIIDSGQAIINQDNSGNLKIEYAPGTGPDSVTTSDGQKVWKILMSDGTTVDSYTAGSVVVGEASGTATNVIVNTVTGGTGNQANVVVGGNTGSASVKVEGGLPTVVGNSNTNSGTTVIEQTP